MKSIRVFNLFGGCPKTPRSCHCEAFFAEAIPKLNNGDCFVTKSVLSYGRRKRSSQ